MKKNSLSINIIFNFIAQIITYITPFVLAPYLSRVLKPEGIGQYSFSYSIVYYFSIVIVFGFTNYGIKQISKYNDNIVERSKVFWSILFTRLILFVVSSSAYIVLCCFEIFPKKIGLALCLVLFGNVVDTTFYFQGREKFRLVSIYTVFANIFYMIVVFCFVNTQSDLILYTILKSSIILFVNFMLWSYLLIRKEIKITFINIKYVKVAFVGALVFFLPSLASTISPQLDQTMLGYIASDFEVGYYQQIQKLMSIIGSLTYTLSPIILSRISSMHNDSKFNHEAKAIVHNILYLANFIILPAIFGVYSIAKFFVPAYYGIDFIPAINVVYFFLPAMFFSTMSSLLINGYFYPLNKSKIATVVLVVSAVIHFLLNLILIRFMGASGAALVSTICEIITFILFVLYSKKDIDYKIVFKNMLKPFISSLFMFIIISLINWAITSNINLDNSNLKQLIIIVATDVIVGMIIYVLSNLLIRERNTYGILMKINNLLKGKKDDIVK